LSVWFMVWIVTTQCVNFAFYLAVTRAARGWARTVAVYLMGYLVPLTVCLLYVNPLLHGGARGASGTLSVGFALFYGLWGVLAVAYARTPFGRNLFSVLVCGVQQIGALSVTLLAMRYIRPEGLGALVGCLLMAGMGAFLFFFILRRVRRMPDRSGWWYLNVVAAANLVLLYATGLWPTSVVEGGFVPVVNFVIAGIVAVVFIPVALAFAERSRAEHALKLVESNTKALLAELVSARSIEAGTRRIRHDTRHHVDVVREMLAAGRVQEADEYLSNVNRHELLTVNMRRRCGNPLVDALLAVADRKAVSCGKVLSATSDVLASLPLDEPDAVSLIGNLLENAIRHGSGDRVRASVTLEHGKILRLLVSNGVEPGFALVGGLPTETEGVGLMSVRQVVEKYHGVMGYEVKDDMLVCKVVIGCA